MTHDFRPKVKRQESSVSPELQISPLTKNPFPNFLIGINMKPDNPSVPFRSCALKICGAVSTFTFGHNGSRVSIISIPVCMFSTPCGQKPLESEKERGEKTDTGTRQHAAGNWISFALHTTRSHSRLTAAHAKDAQALAKIFSKHRLLNAVSVAACLTVILAHTVKRMVAQLPFKSNDNTKIRIWRLLQAIVYFGLHNCL